MSRIVIDARIINGSTGVYAQRLLHYLHAKELSDEYMVLIPSDNFERWSDLWPKFTFLKADQKNYTFAEQLSLVLLLWGLHPDLTHFTFPAQPVLWFGKSITTIHDTTLIRYENVDTNIVIYKIRKYIFTALLKLVMWRSKKILTPTEYVRDDLIKYAHGNYADKTIVTLEAGDPMDVSPEAIKSLSGKRFLFFIGNAFPYKNIRRTIDAFTVLKKEYPDLCLGLAGKKDYFYEQLESYVSEQSIEDVHFLGRISDGEKRWAYQHAAAFVTASLSEGFHIPVLEAMYEDCPVISSNATCLPEVGGDAVIYFDPYSTDDLVRAVKSILDDAALRDYMIARGRERVQQFSWARMADQTLDAYKLAL